MRILGVDPGAYGALALLSEEGVVLDILDMPTLLIRRGKTDKKDVDGYTLGALLRSWKIDVAFIEQVGGMPGQSPMASFTFGRSAGAPEFALKTLGARVELIPPITWKRSYKLRAGKDEARALAMRMWPERSASFKRKRDDGRAEACLIGEFGRRRLALEGGSTDVFG